MIWYTNSQAPFIFNGKKAWDLPPNTVVVKADETASLPSFTKVIHDGITGEVLTSRLEPYIENYDKDCVDVSDIETPDIYDPAQFVLWKKYKQTNMCGEMSVCYVIGKREDVKMKLSDFLLKWEAKDLPFWKRVFSSPKARGTYPAELVSMFATHGYKAKELSKDLEMFPLGRYTPYHLSRIHLPIVSVKIDANTGRLRGQGVGHWVTIVDVLLERTGYGFVTLYNPFPNRIEKYSWNEFISSAGTYPYGAALIEEQP